MSNRIYIYASEIACIINKNPYDVLSGFNRIVNKYFKVDIDSLQKDLNTNQTTIEQEIIKIDQEPKTKVSIEKKNNLIKQKANVSHQINNLEQCSTTDQQKVDKIIPDYIPDMTKTPASQKTELRKVIKEKCPEKKVDEKLIENFINKGYGTKTEDSAIDMFEKKFGVTLDKSQKWYEYKLKTTNNFDYYIGGKMDGIYKSKSQTYIVEIKNRMRGFFTYLKEYEKCQVYIYMILTDITNVKLVERYNNNIKTTNITLEESYKAEILNALDIFIKNLDLFLQSNLINEYLLMNDAKKTQFIHKLYLDEINEYYNNNTQEDDTECMFE